MFNRIALILGIVASVNFLQADSNLVVAVDATQTTGPLEPFWASQIIHPTESLLTEQGTNLLQLMTVTGAARQYIRIYNQPETAVRVGADGVITYDWSRFDAMAEMILATGCKLKVMFFGMPVELAAYPKNILKRDNGSRVCTSPPGDYKEWQALCAEFTRHVIAKYGLNEVKRWTFRCWNEPDLSGFWYKADVEEYLKLYDHFAQGVKEVCPEIRIGGPALSSTQTFKNPKSFKLFLEHVAHGVNYATGQPGVPLDFLAVHTYGGSGGGGGPGRKYPDTAYMIEQQNLYAEMRDAYPELKDVPIHVEEWGETSGGTKGIHERPMADVRNSEFSSAFLVDWVAQHIGMKQVNDRHFESFTFCASGYEKRPSHDFMGYRTLDTKNHFVKPLLNAYTLLDRVARELVPVEITPAAGGSVRAFASRNQDRVTVVLVNFQHDQIESKGAMVPVCLKLVFPWAADTQVQMKEWRIDVDHSNAYTAYKAMGAPESPAPEQIAEVRKQMLLECTEAPRQATCDELAKIALELPCNAVSLIEFIKVPEAETRPVFNYPPVIEGAQVETYKRVGAQELKLWLFGVDSAAAPKPAIVFFFGGGWRKGSPEQFVRQGRYLADRGMVAVMADYRVASRNHVKPAECVADAKSCVRWLRQNAGRLGIDPRRLAAAGGSAGGHLAVSAATLPGLDEADEDLSVSSIPDAAVLFNAGFMMAPFGSLKMRGFGANHKKESFGCEPEAISPIHHVRSGLPPMLILHGTADKVIPFESAEAFCKEMTDAGNRCELVGYEGMDHGFYLGDRYYETLGEMVRFLNSIGFLPKGL